MLQHSDYTRTVSCFLSSTQDSVTETLKQQSTLCYKMGQTVTLWTVLLIYHRSQTVNYQNMTKLVDLALYKFIYLLTYLTHKPNRIIKSSKVKLWCVVVTYFNLFDDLKL